jgi:hypothetical protein
LELILPDNQIVPMSAQKMKMNRRSKKHNNQANIKRYRTPVLHSDRSLPSRQKIARLVRIMEMLSHRMRKDNNHMMMEGPYLPFALPEIQADDEEASDNSDAESSSNPSNSP